MQSGGLNVLTDPVFSERASPVSFLGPRRAQPPGVALRDFPPIDVVLVSHNHYDHLDRLSAVLLNQRSQGKTLWGGWAVFAPDLHWYFSGDAGYSRDFADTRQRFAPRGSRGFDLALLAIGAYEPRWFMQAQHINPTEAVQAHLDLGTRQSLGIHWGTFNLTDESLDQPPKDLAQARSAKGLAEPGHKRP